MESIFFENNPIQYWTLELGQFMLLQVKNIWNWMNIQKRNNQPG